MHGGGEAERHTHPDGGGGLAAPARLGFDDVALLEVGHIVGIFNYLTRLADGFGLQLDRRTIEASETGVSLRQMAEQAADD